MATISYTPAVREALNLRVINSAVSGAANARISGLLDICGVRGTDSQNVVAFILGKSMKLKRRHLNSDAMTKRGANIYEHRARLGTYVDFLEVPREDALYPAGIDKIAAVAELAGMDIAEGPTRMVEAIIPASLAIQCHTGQNFFDTDHPIKPGSSTTFANLADLGALDFDSYDEAERRLAQGIKDEDGRSANSRVRVLAVGQKYKRIGMEIVENPRPRENPGDNLRTREGVRLIVVPDWDDDLWCVFDTDLDNDRPFYYFEGRPLTLKPLETDPNGTYATKYGHLLWAVDGDIGVVLGNPRRAFMSANPANAATIAAKYRARFELNDQTFALGN